MDTQSEACLVKVPFPFTDAPCMRDGAIPLHIQSAEILSAILYRLVMKLLGQKPLIFMSIYIFMMTNTGPYSWKILHRLV